MHVAADDRTGALEVAAALADRGAGTGAGVPVAVWPDQLDEATVEVSVIDLVTRHLDSGAAHDRARSVTVQGMAAHKIDSTLRGNWAAELAGRRQASGRRILLVPALPALGRVCIDGIVMVDGRPVDEGNDARGAPLSARPADHLAEHGLTADHLATIDDVEAWLTGSGAAAVADAADQATIDSIAGAWSRHPEVLLAGTSAAIAAALGPHDPPQRSLPYGPVLIVVGSLNPVARDQVRAVIEAGAVEADDRQQAIAALEAGRHAVLASVMVTGTVAPDEASTVAAGLAEDVHRIVREVGPGGCILVIGGDTAAAVLGGERVMVRGSVVSGTAWVISPRFRQPVITRAGGFGDRNALVELLWGTLP